MGVKITNTVNIFRAYLLTSLTFDIASVANPNIIVIVVAAADLNYNTVRHKINIRF